MDCCGLSLILLGQRDFYSSGVLIKYVVNDKQEYQQVKYLFGLKKGTIFIWEI